MKTKKSATRGIRVDKEVYDEIKKRAHENGQTITGYIRAKYLKEKIER